MKSLVRRKGEWDEPQPLNKQWLRAAFQSSEEGKLEKLQDQIRALADYMIAMAMKAIEADPNVAPIIVDCIAEATHEQWEIVK